MVAAQVETCKNSLHCIHVFCSFHYVCCISIQSLKTYLLIFFFRVYMQSTRRPCTSLWETWASHPHNYIQHSACICSPVEVSLCHLQSYVLESFPRALLAPSNSGHDTTTVILNVLSLAAFMLQQQGWVAAAEALWPMQPAVFTIWPHLKMFANPCHIVMYD